VSQTAATQRFSVTNNVVLLIIYTFMGACLLVASILALTQPLPYAENPLLMKVTMGWLGFPLAVALIALNVRKILTRRDAIVVDERGITDHTGGMAPGFISWDDLEEVFLLKLKDDTYLCAVPRDYNAWCTQLSTRQRRLAQANVDAGFAPIRIQFKKVTDTYTAQDGLCAVRRFHPEKVTRVRKPKY
jgi:hypothetical protein